MLSETRLSGMEPPRRPAASDGRQRVVIEGISPAVDGGKFPAKRAVGDRVAVEADVFCDGHDALRCVLLFRFSEDPEWREVPMSPIGNDRWRAAFLPDRHGCWEFAIEAWVDRFETWRRALAKWVRAGSPIEEIAPALLSGAEIVQDVTARAPESAASELERFTVLARSGNEDAADAVTLALDETFADLVGRHAERRFSVRVRDPLAILVERERARFSTWYELFPRSASPDPSRSGTLRDVIDRVPEIASLGFDVLYLPPIHPVGRTGRKGPNNRTTAVPGDPGSPWAIGSEDGGHTSIHPDLGGPEDFRALVAAASEHGIELALDLAFQCSPDHPWVREHPRWFRRRPDGSIQYAENPPKKYQDIYPLDFENDDWRGLWEELRGVVLHWIGEGVRVFRVDNPHTKPFRFWRWLISEIREKHPDVIFLSEAFTRPKVMARLAKVGFSQSYTYFTWRNTKAELISYFTDLTRTELREYFRPNLWPNTPDILPEHLQTGGRPAFLIRLILAATLGANYGIYGPAFELAVGQPSEPGSEEYLDSEKYEIRHWDLAAVDSLAPFIARVNRARRENPALQNDHTLHFHEIDNDRLLCYSKTSYDGENAILVIVNLDPYYAHGGWTRLDATTLGIDPEGVFQVHDLLGNSRYLWQGIRNFVELSPWQSPALVLRVLRRVRKEQDFSYYM